MGFTLPKGEGLIYMSIREEVERRCSENRLVALYPRASWAPVRRMLYLSEGVYDLLTREWPTAKEVERWAKLEAFLSHFVEGGLIDSKYMKALNKPARHVWEIRSRRPRPSLRVLGRFADVDVFVATNVAVRDELGGMGTREWRNVIVECSRIWRQLFPSYQPIQSDDIHDCISENAFTDDELGR